MFASLLRLLALRPLLGMAILGVPVLVLIGIGLLAVLTVKAMAVLFVPVLVIGFAIWFFRRMARA